MPYAARVGSTLTSSAPFVRNAWRIVVADDYADAADMLALALYTCGCTPYTARDGPTALAQIREHKPHAVLLELALPGMAGWDVTRAVRRDPSTTRTVMITVTAWGRNCDRVQAERCGFDAYVLKPANVSHLLRLIGSALEQKGSRSKNDHADGRSTAYGGQ
jgi:DNA-binding response OmpR family regulator